MTTVTDCGTSRSGVGVLVALLMAEIGSTGGGGHRHRFADTGQGQREVELVRSICGNADGSGQIAKAVSSHRQGVCPGRHGELKAAPRVSDDRASDRPPVRGHGDDSAGNRGTARVDHLAGVRRGSCGLGASQSNRHPRKRKQEQADEPLTHAPLQSLRGRRALR